MFKKLRPLPNHSIRVRFKGKIINRGVGYGLEILSAMRELFNGQRDN